VAIWLLKRLQFAITAPTAYNVAWETAAMNDVNPFESPQTSNEDYVPDAPFDPTNAESIRRKHLSREANIQSLGAIFLIGSVTFGVGGVALIFAAFENLEDEDPLIDTSFYILFAVFSAGISLLHGWIGVGLCRLDRTIRLLAILLCVLWLAGFYAVLPVAISVVGVIMLLGQRADYVFSPEYQRIRAATPHIRYGSPIWGILLLVGISVAVFALITTF
jgi:hypothetical protein